MPNTQNYPYDLFVSYADQDRAWVEGYLLDALQHADVRCHSETAFALGAPRLLGFERAVKESHHILLVLTPAYLANSYMEFLNILAQSYGIETGTWPVIPLVFQSVELPPRLSQLVTVDATSCTNWDAAVARLCQELRTPIPNPTPRPRCPYPGMTPFNESDDAHFFGRSREIEEMLQRLRLDPFLAVIGPSGSGKSSLISAGLIPALLRSSLFGSGEWLIRKIRPGELPLAALADALEGDPDHLDQAVIKLLAGGPATRRLLIVVDQFEEVFTRVRADAAVFQKALLDLNRIASCYVILAVRADFYPDLMNAPIWPQIQTHRLELTPLTEEGLRQAIMQPAKNAGVSIDPALAERLIKDASDEPGALPFVQETLLLLWEKLERRFLPLHAYETLSLSGRTGLQVAMARRADATLGRLSTDQQKIARRIFGRLVQFYQGRLLRRQDLISALISTNDDPLKFDTTLQHLADNRLLTLGGETGNPNRKVDIAHEALIAGWPTLRTWVEEDQDFLSWRQRLSERLIEWKEQKGELLHDAALIEAERWLQGRFDGLNSDERDYIQTSIASRTREKESRRRIRQAFGFGLATVATMTVAALLLFALWQSRQATVQANLASTAIAAEATSEVRRSEAVAAQATSEVRRNEALSRQLAAEALNVASNKYDLALLLSLQAYKIAPTVEAKAALLNVLEFDPHLIGYVERSFDPLRSVAFSTDSRMLLTATCRKYGNTPISSPDPTNYSRMVAAPGVDCLETDLRLWDAETGQKLGGPYVAPNRLTGAAFSSDNQVIAFISNATMKNSIMLWDVRANTLRDTSLNHNASSLAFKPEGHVLASAGFDKRIRLWNIETGQQIGQSFIGHNSYVVSVAFSPDGKILASGDNDGVVMLWDVETGQLLGEPLMGQTWPVFGLAFSPDGASLASVGSKGTLGTSSAAIQQGSGNVIVWDVSTRKVVFRIDTGLGVSKVSFDRSTGILAIGTETIALWNSKTWTPIGQPLNTHTVLFMEMALSPDGTRLAAAGMDEVTLWDTTDKPRLAQPMPSHSEWTSSVAFSPDGHTLASSSTDHSIQLSDITTGKLIGEPLASHSAIVRSIDFSPDGRMLASGGDDRAVIIWDVENRRIVGEPHVEHESGVMKVRFSPDGRWLASSSYGADKTVVLWEAATGRPVGNPFAVDDGLLFPSADSSGFLGGFITALAYSADGRTLFGAGNWPKIMEWNLATRDSSVVSAAPVPANYIGTMSAFTSDGETIASGTFDGIVLLWETRTGQVLGQIHPPTSQPIGSLSFGPHDDILAVTTTPLLQQDDKTTKKGEIYLWDVQTLKPLGQLPASHGDEVTTSAFSPDGRFLASGAGDGTLMLWDMNLESWQKRACQIANRNLTREEWNQYVGSDLPYESICSNVSSDDAPVSTSTETPVAPTTQLSGTRQATLQPTNTRSTPSTPTTATSTPFPIPETGWRSATSVEPGGLTPLFPAFVQCRLNVDSNHLVQEYLGMWIVENTRDDRQVSGGHGKIILETESGTPVKPYTITLNLAAGQTGWVMSDQNWQGLSMRNSQPITTVLRLAVEKVDWKPVGEQSKSYQYSIGLHSHTTYGSPAYPQHVAVFRVHNLSELTMKAVFLVAIIQDRRGDTVDILTQGVNDELIKMRRGYYGSNLAPGEYGFFAAKSHSTTGRCVGQADPEGYTMHYWLNYETEEGETMTQYYQLDLPGSEP